MNAMQITIALIFISLIALAVGIWWRRTQPAQTDKTPDLKTTAAKPSAEVMRELRLQ